MIPVPSSVSPKYATISVADWERSCRRPARLGEQPGLPRVFDLVAQSGPLLQPPRRRRSRGRWLAACAPWLAQQLEIVVHRLGASSGRDFSGLDPSRAANASPSRLMRPRASRTLSSCYRPLVGPARRRDQRRAASRGRCGSGGLPSLRQKPWGRGCSVRGSRLARLSPRPHHISARFVAPLHTLCTLCPVPGLQQCSSAPLVVGAATARCRSRRISRCEDHRHSEGTALDS